MASRDAVTSLGAGLDIFDVSAAMRAIKAVWSGSRTRDRFCERGRQDCNQICRHKNVRKGPEFSDRIGDVSLYIEPAQRLVHSRQRPYARHERDMAKLAEMIERKFSLDGWMIVARDHRQVHRGQSFALRVAALQHEPGNVPAREIQFPVLRNKFLHTASPLPEGRLAILANSFRRLCLGTLVTNRDQDFGRSL